MTQWGLDSLFNPAKRHMDEEKQRLQSTREEVGDSSGGKRIDLTSGKVVIQRGSHEEKDDAPAGADKAESDEPAGKPATAAERAKLRHRNRRAANKN
jgi:hypothetical protein